MQYKRSAFAKHLVNNKSCIKYANLEWFKINEICCDSVKMDAICIMKKKTFPLYAIKK